MKQPESSTPKGKEGLVFEDWTSMRCPNCNYRIRVPAQIPSETLERMPTDAVIVAICKWMAWDYNDKQMRADASQLYGAILDAAPQVGGKRTNAGMADQPAEARTPTPEATAANRETESDRGKPAVAAFSSDKKETPRTDDAQDYDGHFGFDCMVVTADFARQLERELAEAQLTVASKTAIIETLLHEDLSARGLTPDDVLADVERRLHDMKNLQTASAWPHVQGVAMAEKMVRELRSSYVNYQSSNEKK